MVYVALAEAALLAVVVTVLGSLLRSLQRAHARREDLLLNQLLHVAGKPWQPAPAKTAVLPTDVVAPMWTATPEQHPLDL